MKTDNLDFKIWFCEQCQAVGVVSFPKNTHPSTIMNLVIDDHTRTSIHCSDPNIRTALDNTIHGITKLPPWVQAKARIALQTHIT